MRFSKSLCPCRTKACVILKSAHVWPCGRMTPSNNMTSCRANQGADSDIKPTGSLKKGVIHCLMYRMKVKKMVVQNCIWKLQFLLFFPAALSLLCVVKLKLYLAWKLTTIFKVCECIEIGLSPSLLQFLCGWWDLESIHKDLDAGTEFFPPPKLFTSRRQ